MNLRLPSDITVSNAYAPFAERRETKHKIPQRKDAWPPAPRKIASRPFPKPESRQ